MVTGDKKKDKDPKPLFVSFDGASFMPGSWKGWLVLGGGLTVVLFGGWILDVLLGR